MTRDEVLAVVAEVIHEKLDRNEKRVELTEATALGANLGADSLDQVEVLMELEDRFGLKGIPDAEAEKLTTVGLMVNYIFGALETRPPNAVQAGPKEEKSVEVDNDEDKESWDPEYDPHNDGIGSDDLG